MAGGKSRLLRNNDFAKNHSSIGLAGGAGLKILCPLKTCGFDSHLGHPADLQKRQKCKSRPHVDYFSDICE